MRKIIALKPDKPKYSEQELKAQIAEVVKLFDAYLDEYPIKSAKSKHAVMGPVAKVLDRAQSGQWDAEPLTGYALRMHEMNPRVRGFVSQTAAENLRKGTQALLDLCQQIPVTALATTIEQIDYGLYFQRRAKGMAWMEGQRAAWIEFLKARYPDDAAFRSAWALGKKDVFTLTTVYFFGASSKRYKEGNATLRSDVDEFRNQVPEQDADAIVEEEEN